MKKSLRRALLMLGISMAAATVAQRVLYIAR